MDEDARTAEVRVGFVVSSAVGHAVTRHRLQRQLRALVSARLHTLPRTDWVVRATPAAAGATSAQLAADLDRCLARVGS